MTLFSRHYLAVALGLGAAALAASPTLAQTATLSLNVTVQNACSVSVAGGTLDFGTYTSGQATNLDAEGIIEFNGCANTSAVVALDGGGGDSVYNRRLRSAAGANLAYQLYTDANRSTVWGSLTEEVPNQVTFAAGTESIPVYGQIPSGQTPTADDYLDSVTITMTF